MSLAAVTRVPPTDLRRAYSAGVVAGMLTLALGWTILSQLGWTGVAVASSGSTLSAGDCLRIPEGDRSRLQTVDCSVPHEGEVVGLATHPDGDLPFPGDDEARVLFEQDCRTVTADYLGADHLTTTLDAQVVVPTESEWNDGVHTATCYVTIGDGSDPLTESVKNRAGEFARGDIVAIDRLLVGDCFDPAGPGDPFALRSGDLVQLTDCSGSFTGLFFGREVLPYPERIAAPSDRELADASTTACSAAFESFFGVDSAVGFTFRFWRPSQSRWNDGDRQVLCAVLSDTPIDGPFEPAGYPELYKLGTGQCFGLLPEQDALSITLDDHVRPIRCSEPHGGQMIGGGTLEADQPFPGDVRVKQLAGQECRSLFVAFIGIEPARSVHGEFSFWYPNEARWDAGDTRYACAILDDGLTESLRDSRR